MNGSELTAGWQSLALPAPPTDDELGSTGLLDAFDGAIRPGGDVRSVVRWQPTGRDDGVRVLDNAGGLCRKAKSHLPGIVFSFSSHSR